MALYYDLPVFKDVYKLTLSLFELTQHFSREYKFTLGQDMKRDCRFVLVHAHETNQDFKAQFSTGFKTCAFVVFTGQISANKCKDRVLYLEQFMDDFEVLKLEIRLCAAVRCF